MTDGLRRLFGAFAASVLLAASALVAAPAPAQTGPGGTYGSCQYDPGSGNWYRMYVTHWEPCSPYDDCQYDPWTGNWYRMYVTHWEPCDWGAYSGDSGSQQPTEPAGP